jgi:hypothetical protein
MDRYVVRVWLPDRPGALGQVASRIGAVRGDVVGIEILERGAGRAIDELVVELPEGMSMDLLVAEIGEVDGVDVEDVRPLTSERHADDLDALDAMAHLAEQWHTGGDQLLCEEVSTLLEADWAVVALREPPSVLAVRGTAPPLPWLFAFSEGSRHLADDVDAGPQDAAWAEMPATGRVVAVGRKAPHIRWRERTTLALVARLADALGQSDDSHRKARSTARCQTA